jgi:hypothetical protein
MGTTVPGPQIIDLGGYWDHFDYQDGGFSWEYWR